MAETAVSLPPAVQATIEPLPTVNLPNTDRLTDPLTREEARQEQFPQKVSIMKGRDGRELMTHYYATDDNPEITMTTQDDQGRLTTKKEKRFMDAHVGTSVDIKWNDPSREGLKSEDLQLVRYGTPDYPVVVAYAVGTPQNELSVKIIKTYEQAKEEAQALGIPIEESDREYFAEGKKPLVMVTQTIQRRGTPITVARLLPIDSIPIDTSEEYMEGTAQEIVQDGKKLGDEMDHAQTERGERARTRERLHIPLNETQIHRGKEMLAWFRKSNATPIVVSPHPDDGELSLGGFMEAMNQQTDGKLHHIVVFTKGSEEAQPYYETRKEEVRAASNQLGLNQENIEFLDQKDLVYRLAESEDGSLQQRFQKAKPQARSLPIIPPEDKSLVNAIAVQLQTTAQASMNPVLFVPIAGIGRHADHYLTRRAAELAQKQLKQEGIDMKIILYDEHPYNQHYRPMSLQLIGQAVPAQYIDGQHARHRAIGEHRSQHKLVYQPHGKIPDPESLPPERFFIPKDMMTDIRS